MNANEILSLIENNRAEYNYFGLRGMTANPITNEDEFLSVGDEPNYSYIWDDGNPTDDLMNGTCALAIDMDADEQEIQKVIKDVRQYTANQIVLLGSRYMEYGNDENEIVMRGFVTVLGEWRI